MTNLILPENYDPLIDLMESQENKRLFSAGTGIRSQFETSFGAAVRRPEYRSQ